MTRITRNKETYYLQRHAMGKVESEAITRYIDRAEAKFDKNWSEYEAQLQNYLTSSKKQYKDWMQNKDE